MTEERRAPRGRYRLDDGARFRMVDGEGLVLRQRTAEVVGVNATGAFLLERLAEGDAFADAVAALGTAFDVELEAAERDGAAFVTALLDEGLLEPVDRSD